MSERRAFRIRGTQVVRDLLVANFEVIATDRDEALRIVQRAVERDTISWRYSERVDAEEPRFSIDDQEVES